MLSYADHGSVILHTDINYTVKLFRNATISFGNVSFNILFNSVLSVS